MSESKEKVNYVLFLQTEAGDVSYDLSSKRTDGPDGFYYEISFPRKESIKTKFDGFAELNSFVFKREFDTQNYVLTVKKYDQSGIYPCTGTLTFTLSGFSGVYTGGFITGISFTNSGFYSGTPQVQFASYSGFQSISVNKKNLISSNAGGSFQLILSGGSGTGALATAHTKKENIKLFTNVNENNKFRTITGVSIENPGYAYTGEYSIKLPESIIDYPNLYSDEIASLLGYGPVNFSPEFLVSAGNASGKVFLTSGNSGSVTGVIILGAGSGYDNILQKPLMTFLRNPEDTISINNASGSGILNASGENFNYENCWTVSGSRNFSSEMSDYNLSAELIDGKYTFNQIEFSKENPDFWLKIKLKNSTNFSPLKLNFEFKVDQQETKKFTISSENNYSILPDINLFDEDVIILDPVTII